MHKRCLLPPSALRKTVDLSKFDFKTTSDITPLSSVIGQERAVSAINFALEIGDSGYNIFVAGSYGTGRTTIVSDLLTKSAAAQEVPSDWVYVYNFNAPDEPNALQLPAGQANKFRKRMNRLILNLMVDLQKTFESKNYLESKNELVDKFQQAKHKLYMDTENHAATLNIKIKSTNAGFATMPVKDGKVISSEAFDELPEAEQAQINQNAGVVQKSLQQMIRKMNLLDRELDERLDKLNEEVASFVVENHFVDIREAYAHCPDVTRYLKNAIQDLVENVEDFLQEPGESDEREISPSLPQGMAKYKVNVLIDNSGRTGAPVVYETNPTYTNLFGTIEKKSFQGYIYTDYTLIKGGSLVSANGGYLMLDAEQLMKHPTAYEALKRALRSKLLKIEDYSSLYGTSTSVALRPDPLPLKVKVVLIGHNRVFSLLHSYDEEFRKIFKVRADFDHEVHESATTIKRYMQFIARVVKEEELKPFNRDAVRAVIEYGYRLSEHQKKISIRFGELVKIIREASFWAGKRRHKFISAADVQFAIESMRYRHNLIEDKVHESLMEQTVKVQVKGKVVGQINGLAVYNLGDYAFGRPSRITVNTFIGARGIINIERESKLSGKIHDKGLLVLGGYFSHKFGSAMPLGFSATITFEQNYGLIDGDSASSTELYALISALSGVPIDQGIAVTGSVNQKGEVQAIGGVNEKIEGFFKVCQARRLTSSQGVIIPRSNEKNLMLPTKIIDAVKDGKFHIWSVEHIEEGLEILCGQKCGRIHKDHSFTKESIFEKVRQQLIAYAQASHDFRKNLGDTAKKENQEENGV